MSVLAKTDFYISMGERALATAAQAGVALLGVDAIGLLDIDPVALASAMGGAALLSVLKTLAAITITGTASLTGTERVPGRRADRDGVMDGRDTPPTDG